MKNKRAFIAAILSAMLVTAGFPVAASAAENEVLLGDVYGNGVVNVVDATLVQMIEAHNKKALQDGGIVIACGMSKYDNDSSVASVFERADQNMYVNKSDLKAGKSG